MARLGVNGLGVSIQEAMTLCCYTIGERIPHWLSSLSPAAVSLIALKYLESID